MRSTLQEEVLLWIAAKGSFRGLEPCMRNRIRGLCALLYRMEQILGRSRYAADSHMPSYGHGKGYLLRRTLWDGLDVMSSDPMEDTNLQQSQAGAWADFL